MHTTTKFTLWTAALLVVSAPQLASSASCNKAGFHCIGNNVYQLCLDGSLTTNTDAMVCPTGTKCSADCNEHCLPEASTPCIRCETGKSFRCVGETSFQTCVDTNVPYPDINTCSNGTFCSELCAVECSEDRCYPIADCTSNGQKLPNIKNPKNYFLCTKFGATYIVKEYSCPGTSTFKDTKCVEEPTTEKPKFVCPGVGRFPDPTGVSGYYACTLIDGAFKDTYLACPPGTTFNKTSLQCSSSNPTQITSTTPVGEFVCPSSGKFSDPTSCNNYILCTSTDGVTFAPTKYTCPPPSFYNPDTLKCTNTRPSSCSVETRSALSTTEFECPGVGRFEDPDSCNHYYLCVAEEEEDSFFNTYSYKPIYFPCPDSSRYNPETQQCTYIDIPCMK